MTRTSDRRVERRYDPLLTEKVVYSVGPQHPSLPAPMRLVVQCDGELIEHVTPRSATWHRVEQLCARRSYPQCAALYRAASGWRAATRTTWSAPRRAAGGPQRPERAQ
jgi:NADH:ubiquinone oxidoreductase subunit D